MKIMRTLILVVVVTLLATACGTDSRVASPTGDDEHDVPTTGDGATTVPDESGRGWLDDGDWVRSAGDAAFGAEEDGASRVETEMLAEPSDGDDVATTPGLEPPIDDSPLQAGSIDDGADVSAYLEYRDLILGRGVQVRSLEVTESTLIEVLGENGLPVLDALVEVWDPHTDATDPIVSLRTTADGTVRFLPATVAADSLDLFDLVVTANEVSESVSIERGEDSVTVTLPVAGGVDGAVPLDIHFVLDATGSMGDEIDRLRDNMSSIAEQIAALPSRPDVHFGMTVYRDQGDAFVTRTFDLTDDLADFLDALDEVYADGGGDYPEAMDEALADALAKPAWRRDGAVELMVLIADAPPQVGRQVDSPYTASALAAAERGVKIFPVAASGTDDQAEYVMRELAFVTGGRFVFLSYGVDGAATGDSTDITPDDYDELPLDQLVVKLVEDELATLTGGADVSQTTTTTTIDPAQTTTTVEQ